MADQPADGAAVTAAEIDTTLAASAASLDGADGTTHKRRAEDSTAASPRKKARNDQIEAEESDGVDEGEVNSDSGSKASASSKQASRTWNSGITTQLRTSFGSSSKSSKSSKLAAAKPASKLEATSADSPPPPPEQVAPEIRAELVAAVTAGQNTILPPVDWHGQTWEIPTFKVGFEGETWDDMFKSLFSQWSTEFISKNQATVDQVGLDHKFLGRVCLETLEGSLPGVNPALISVSKNHLKRNSKRSLSRQVATGWTYSWTDSQKEGKRAKKEAKALAKAQAKEKADQEGKQSPEQSERPRTRQTRSSSKKAEAQDSDTSRSADWSDRKSSTASSGPSLPDVPLPPLSEVAASQQRPSVAEEHIPMDEDEGEDENAEDQQSSDKVPGRGKAGSETVPPTEDELEQRRHYFPGIPDDAVFCLTCASYGHNTPDCPETTCKFCQQDHFSYSCPSRQRCTKCKQLGHTKASCKEKLAMAAGEGFMECAFCQAQDHQEEQCPEIWETYRPQIGHIKQVKSVPIFCYSCGAEGHFGTDCGLADRKLPPSATWSNAGASMYIDPASSEEAIAFKNPLPEPQAESAPVIPGRSIKPQSHIIFEDSGDEEVGQGFLRAPATGPRRPGQIQITSNINFGGSAGPSAQNGGGAQQGSSNSNNKRRKQRGPSGPASLPPKPQTAAPAPAPQASKKGKNNKRNGKSSQQQQQQQQQPPLPPGPPPGGKGWRPPEFQARGANSTRGRGGFSSLGRGGRRGGGRN